jgi:hypothetical protein
MHPENTYPSIVVTKDLRDALFFEKVSIDLMQIQRLQINVSRQGADGVTGFFGTDPRNPGRPSQSEFIRHSQKNHNGSQGRVLSAPITSYITEVRYIRAYTTELDSRKTPPLSITIARVCSGNRLSEQLWEVCLVNPRLALNSKPTAFYFQCVRKVMVLF